MNLYYLMPDNESSILLFIFLEFQTFVFSLGYPNPVNLTPIVSNNKEAQEIWSPIICIFCVLEAITKQNCIAF